MKTELSYEPETKKEIDYLSQCRKILGRIGSDRLTAAIEIDKDLLRLRVWSGGNQGVAHVTLETENALFRLERTVEKAIQDFEERLAIQKDVQWPSEFESMAEKPLTPKVGVAVVALKMRPENSTQILLGLRHGSHGAGQWALPGGHLELGESPEVCARRELAEETAIRADSLKRLGWGNSVMPDEGLHYVTLFLEARVHPETMAALVDGKTLEWQWFDMEKPLPENLFGATKVILRQEYGMEFSDE